MPKSKFVPKFAIVQAVCLTVLLSVLFFWDYSHVQENTVSLALQTARTSAHKDLQYRNLLLSAGGVYMEVSDQVQPLSSIKHRKDQNIFLGSGKKLTVILPKRFIQMAKAKVDLEHQIFEKSSIRTLQPISKDDDPDDWEKYALSQLVAGKSEFYELISAEDGEMYFRYLHSLYATEQCVKNRPGQNLTVGDLYGGLSITLPLAPFQDGGRKHNQLMIFTYGFMWVAGLFGIGISFDRLRARDKKIHQAQSQTLAALSQLDSVFETSPVGLLITNGEVGIVKSNKIIQNLCLQTGSQFGDVAPAAALPQHCFEIIKSAVEQIKNGRKKVLFELERKTESQTGYYHCIAVPLAVQDRFLITFHDMSRIKETQLALNNTSEELEKTFDAIDDIITVQDVDMKITAVNRAAVKHFQATEQELLGKYCYELFRGAPTPCEGCPEIQSLKDGESHTAEIRHENLAKTYAVCAAPIIDEHGQVVKIVHCAKDVTETRELETQLRQAQKMEAIGTLAGGIAHDFNNILVAIIGFSELAKSETPEDSSVHDDLDEILKAGLRAKELVRQVLTFSRRADQEYQPLSVQSILKEAFRLLRSTIPATIEMKLQVDKGCGKVIADPTHIHQVIMNLCTNAYHAMQGQGGNMQISLSQVQLAAMDVKNKLALKPGKYLKLMVSDTGSGMDKKTCQRIFEPYYTTKGKGEGTGLGLSVVHGIVKDIGGHISVYSEKGKGTTFTLYLPVVEDQDVGLADIGAVANVQLPMGEESVMVVDDEESVRTAYKRLLQSLGYKVRVHSGGAEAKKDFAAHHEKYDLVITDMNMPKMSGKDLAVSLKEIRSDIPIILCSGVSDMLDGHELKRFGFDKMMLKPVSLKEMAQEVRSVLDASFSRS